MHECTLTILKFHGWERGMRLRPVRAFTVKVVVPKPPTLCALHVPPALFGLKMRLHAVQRPVGGDVLTTQLQTGTDPRTPYA